GESRRAPPNARLRPGRPATHRSARRAEYGFANVSPTSATTEMPASRADYVEVTASDAEESASKPGSLHTIYDLCHCTIVPIHDLDIYEVLVLSRSSALRHHLLDLAHGVVDRDIRQRFPDLLRGWMRIAGE